MFVCTVMQVEVWIDFYGGWGYMMVSEYLFGVNLIWIGFWKNGELIISQVCERLVYVIFYVSLLGIIGVFVISKMVYCDDFNMLGVMVTLVIDLFMIGVCFLDFKCDVND